MRTTEAVAQALVVLARHLDSAQLHKAADELEAILDEPFGGELAGVLRYYAQEKS